MFFSETILFICAMIITGLLLFLYVYYIITLSDLECDYINAQQCSYRLNIWTVPKLGGHLVVSIFFLLHGYFAIFFVNFPVTGWAAYEFWRVPRGNMGIYDPTEIHNRGQLKVHMRNVLLNMGFHLVAFFVYLYLMIVSMLKSDPALPPPVLTDFTEF